MDDSQPFGQERFFCAESPPCAGFVPVSLKKPGTMSREPGTHFHSFQKSRHTVNGCAFDECVALADDTPSPQ
jgi:hypothetical protein